MSKRDFTARLVVYDWDTMTKSKKVRFMKWLERQVTDFFEDSARKDTKYSKMFTARLMK